MQRRFPGKFYSALAGFIEPGESFEDAVVREMWEEAGVRVSDLRYHSGQPWVSSSFWLRSLEESNTEIRLAISSKPHGRLLRSCVIHAAYPGGPG